MEAKRNILSERLKELRNERGISQYKLVDELRLSRGQLSNYEQGTREPDYDTLILLANYYNVSLDYLLGVSNVRKRFTDNQTQAEANQLVSDIFSLTEQSYFQLESFLELLQFRDKHSKIK